MWSKKEREIKQEKKIKKEMKWSVIENYAETVQRTVTLLQTQKELIQSVIYWILSQVNKQVQVKITF